MKIAVMGGIKRIQEIERLFSKETEIVFYIDNNPQALGEKLRDKSVYSPYNFPRDLIDRIVIFIYDYEIVDQELVDLGVDSSHIINFNDSNMNFEEYKNIFNVDAADRLRLEFRIDYLCSKMKTLEERQKYFEQNYLYEAADSVKNRTINIPKICSVEKTCEKIVSEKCSISRYGDGEFQIILGNAKDVYQSDNACLASRLKDILTSNLQNHIVALADDYGAMEGLRDENKYTIRKYMTEEKRQAHYALLDMDKEYYNAYISRPYVIYPHEEREKARKRFNDLKKIWDGQDVLLVEGDKTRMGVGNDLFGNAGKVERILAPNENAFDVYDEIYDAVLKYGRNKVILIALGPTATVLAYDLAKKGYWALDIGHLDLEYEWFLKGKGYSYITNKYNNEILGDTDVEDVDDQSYCKSIVGIISRT